MHIGELQRIVLRLSNGGWCRYWCHFNYPANPATMAIQVLDAKDGFEPVVVHDIEDLGFVARENIVYEIARTNEDGTPYVSEL